MLGVVACEALYPAVERLVPGAAVRYVPPALHESPTHVPDATAAREAVQSRIDDLDDPSLDRLVVCYAPGGATGLRATHAPLVVSRADDCTSQFLRRRGGGPGGTLESTTGAGRVHEGPDPTPRVERTPEDEVGETGSETPAPWDEARRPASRTRTPADEALPAAGEPKAPGTYYLTRGWIDCALDPYKLSLAYRGEAEVLLAEFEAAARAQPDMRVTWAEGERYERAVAASERVSAEQVGRSLHRVVGDYDRVVLLDAGTLTDFHRAYAERVRALLADLSAAHGDGHVVACRVVAGDRTLLAETLRSPVGEHDDRHVEVVPPGTTGG